MVQASNIDPNLNVLTEAQIEKLRVFRDREQQRFYEEFTHPLQQICDHVSANWWRRHCLERQTTGGAPTLAMLARTKGRIV